jgi:hypothetical protein
VAADKLIWVESVSKRATRIRIVSFKPSATDISQPRVHASFTRQVSVSPMENIAGRDFRAFVLTRENRRAPRGALSVRSRSSRKKRLL